MAPTLSKSRALALYGVLLHHGRKRCRQAMGRWAAHTREDRRQRTQQDLERAVAAARDSAQAATEEAAWERERKVILEWQDRYNELMRETEAAKHGMDVWRTAADQAQAGERRLREEVAQLSGRRSSAESEAPAAMEELQQVRQELTALRHACIKEQSVRQQAEVEIAKLRGDLESKTLQLESEARCRSRGDMEREEEVMKAKAQLKSCEERLRNCQDQLSDAMARERRVTSEADVDKRRAVSLAVADLEAELKRARDQAREKVDQLQRALDEASRLARDAKDRCRALETREQAQRREAAEMVKMLREQKSALHRAQLDAKGWARDRERLQAEAQDLRGRAEALGAQMALQQEAAAAERRQLAAQLEEAEQRARALGEAQQAYREQLEGAQKTLGDLRAALSVKEKMLDDQAQALRGLKKTEATLAASERDWAGRLEDQRESFERELDASRAEVADLQAQVTSLSGIEGQLRDVLRELKRARQREEEASAKPPDEEQASALMLRICDLETQLKVRDEAVRQVEAELRAVRAALEQKEAALADGHAQHQEELQQLRSGLSALEQDKQVLQDEVRGAMARSQGLEVQLAESKYKLRHADDDLRALLKRYDRNKAAMAQKLQAMRSLFQQLQEAHML